LGRSDELCEYCEEKLLTIVNQRIKFDGTGA